MNVNSVQSKMYEFNNYSSYRSKNGFLKFKGSSGIKGGKLLLRRR
jgi:hypothetical protein